MPTPTCLKCQRTIPGDDINVAQDVAYCRDCNQSYRLSDLTAGNDSSANIDLNHPPKGAWFINQGSDTIVGATNRNLVNGVGLLFFALFWNSIVSIFIFFNLVSTLHHLHVPLPDWVPVAKMEGGGEMGLGMTIGLWLFLTPFILIGVFVAGSCLSSIFGRTEVQFNGSQGTVFTGIGALGWKRRFDPAQIKSLRTHQSRNKEGSDTFTILIETREGRQIKFGSLLTNERRQFVLGALQKSITH